MIHGAVLESTNLGTHENWNILAFSVRDPFRADLATVIVTARRDGLDMGESTVNDVPVEDALAFVLEADILDAIDDAEFNLERLNS